MYKTGKRAFDILFSLIVLTVGLPVFLLIALVIKLTSKGPIFHKAIRLKQNGRPFTCYKFRSMYIDANDRLNHILTDEKKREEWEKFGKLFKDPRVTRFGHFLRTTSLDELPQFWNVLISDISVVGPRPIDIKSHEEIERYFQGNAKMILSVKPGITGLWQTSGRNLLSLKERALLDLEYIRKQSFKLDLFLVMKTIPLIFNPKGAY